MPYTMHARRKGKTNEDRKLVNKKWLERKKSKVAALFGVKLKGEGDSSPKTIAKNF